MSDPNYNATPRGGYTPDDDDLAPYGEVRCAGCRKTIEKRYAERINGEEFCGDCAERHTCEGCGRELPIARLEQTRDGWLCAVCLYGYKHVMGVCK